MSDDFFRLERILKNSINPEHENRAPQPEYGDLSDLNKCRLILDAAGKRTLSDIAEDAIGLLDTSAAVYEKNGDYAFGLFASRWCRMMDSASRRLCETGDNREALATGKWLCHESCWNDAAKGAIETGRTMDVECVGGIRLYAEPIFAGGRVVGSINIGYGNPPEDREILEKLAGKFGVSVDELEQAAGSYLPRPDFIVDMAKKRLKTGARLLGQMVEKRQREMELLESKRRMDTMLRNLPGMVYRCRNVENWTMEFVSEGAKALTGYEPGELVGDRKVAYGELVHRQDAGHVWQKVQESLAQKNHFEIEYRIIDRSGEVRWVWERGVGTGRGENGVDLLEGFISDITERRQAEEKQRKLEKELHHSRRMEAMGRLAGGIAHDFNNLLFVILGYTEMILQELRENHPYSGPMKEIYDAAVRGRDLIRQLLAFGRRQMLEMKVVDINRIIEGLEKLLQRTIGEDIELKVNLEADAGYVKADVSRIEQILMNLAVNARDAMPGGGFLRIESTVINLEEDEAGDTAEAEPGRYVLLSVEDTGAGMDRETLEKIYDPFFSTKPKDKGTGLGLSTVYGIVKQHGGKIGVYSQPGKGTRFMVYLPRAEPTEESESVDADDTLPEAGPGLEEESATVLVVEDDPAVRDLTCKILEAQGCRVIKAQSASDAVEKAGEFKEPIHLLVTDVVMPEMKGPEVYGQVLQQHPETKVLYMSGYSEDVLKISKQEKSGFIQKPFSVRDLKRKAAELVGTE